MSEAAAVPKTRVKTRAVYLAARTLWSEPPNSGELIVRPSAERFLRVFGESKCMCNVLVYEANADFQIATLERLTLRPLIANTHVFDRLPAEFALADYWVLVHEDADIEGRDQMARALMDLSKTDADYLKRMRHFIDLHFLACRRYNGGAEQTPLTMLNTHILGKFGAQIAWEHSFMRRLKRDATK